ncbi:MAG: AbrB/MazE/SpoVT family DNA-binding domain-containing protein [Defluviitaleaceae bacterium]|nr:AbrB/MazE/SpoVT family DNA-binding domain-containing protein [Defluviitaleaceae bacterium]
MKEMETRMRTVDMLGRVVLPKGFRKTHKLEEGSTVNVFFDNGTIIIKPSKQASAQHKNAAIQTKCPITDDDCIV